MSQISAVVSLRYAEFILLVVATCCPSHTEPLLSEVERLIVPGYFELVGFSLSYLNYTV